MDSNDTQVHNITDAAPTLEPKTRSNVKRFATLAAVAGAAVLLADSAVKKFKKEKSVTVVVEDKDDAATS
jgi:hypothetical protein